MPIVARAIALLAVPFAVLAAAAAAAQPVYRCGNAYSSVPCPDARAVQTPEPQTARERADADRSVVAQARRADAMERARERREAAPRAAPANVGPASAVANLKPPKKAKGKVRVVKPEDFTVRAPPTSKGGRPAP